ncbi:MAG: hypothetical protein U9N33_12590 [Campylobacterota bacterium]|nr:hypothetical protein [Campylobacterota bacterium]
MDIASECKKLLFDEGIDLNSEIDFDVNGRVHTLSFEYIIDTYMLASDESQLLFFSAMQKAQKAKDMGIDKFFEGMGQLLLMTHLSSKLEVD